MDGVLVQMTDRTWTTDAVKAAAEYAAEHQTWIVLARMLPTAKPRWCGELARSYKLTDAELLDIAEYRRIAADYGVEVVVRIVEVEDSDFELAVVRAANDLGVEEVLVKLPEKRSRPARLRQISLLSALLDHYHHKLMILAA